MDAYRLDQLGKRAICVCDDDLLVDSTCKKLQVEIENQTYRYLHFGLPCRQWGSMNTMNDGTRTTACPEGRGSLEREKVANELATRVEVLLGNDAKTNIVATLWVTT